MQTAIPAYFMRGGTSRGPFFLESDLLADVGLRDRVLLAVMGSPDPRQIDGLGGAHPLTSKVGIVRKSREPGVDLDFLFAQLQPDRDMVGTRANCGNMLAAVVPFALERINRKLKRRTRAASIFPNTASCLRLVSTAGRTERAVANGQDLLDDERLITSGSDEAANGNLQKKRRTIRKETVAYHETMTSTTSAFVQQETL